MLVSKMFKKYFFLWNCNQDICQIKFKRPL